MYKRSALEVAHSGSDLGCHVHEYNSIDVLAVAGPEIIEQVAAAHELRYNVERRFPGAHTQKLNEVRVTHFLHDGSLFEEIFQSHRIVF